MIQTTITIIIVLAAAMIALIRFIRFFSVTHEKCGGCSQSGGGCSLEDLKKEIKIATKTPNHEISPNDNYQI